jgi:pimeloyl-ACP methyl ester carboxylesterase
MPVFKRDDVELYYEEHGTGFPVLLIAPGGMRSAVSFWERTPWNPIDQLAPHYRVIAMDHYALWEIWANVIWEDHDGRE